MYLSNNNDTFPLWKANIHWLYGGKQPGIFEKEEPKFAFPVRPLNPYLSLALKNASWAEFFRCPADRDIKVGVGTVGGSPTEGYSTYDYFGNSYVMNAELMYRRPDKKRPWYVEYKPYRLPEIETSPGRMAVAGDCQWYYSAANAGWDAHFHNDKDWVNMLFLDWHVSFLQFVREADVTGLYSFYPKDDLPDPNSPD